VLHGDFFEVLSPVTVEPDLLLPQIIKLGNHLLDTPFKALLVAQIIFVSCLDYLLVMICVLHVDV
jgi:hypothetical protein